MSSSTAAAPPAIKPKDYLNIDHLLSDEERDMRDSVRAFVQNEVVPHVGDWFEAGEVPARELAPALGRLGVLGMHLEGYGCAGASATAYGLACLELEAGDSGTAFPGLDGPIPKSFNSIAKTSRVSDFTASRVSDFTASRVSDLTASSVSDFTPSSVSDFPTSRISDFSDLTTTIATISEHF